MISPNCHVATGFKYTHFELNHYPKNVAVLGSVCELGSPALMRILIVIHNPTVTPHPSKRYNSHVRKKGYKDRYIYIYICVCTFQKMCIYYIYILLLNYISLSIYIYIYILKHIITYVCP